MPVGVEVHVEEQKKTQIGWAENPLFLKILSDVLPYHAHTLLKRPRGHTLTNTGDSEPPGKENSPNYAGRAAGLRKLEWMTLCLTRRMRVYSDLMIFWSSDTRPQVPQSLWKMQVGESSQASEPQASLHGCQRGFWPKRSNLWAENMGMNSIKVHPNRLCLAVCQHQGYVSSGILH